jgi:hypothetical protein
MWITAEALSLQCHAFSRHTEFAVRFKERKKMPRCGISACCTDELQTAYSQPLQFPTIPYFPSTKKCPERCLPLGLIRTKYQTRSV